MRYRFGRSHRLQYALGMRPLLLVLLFIPMTVPVYGGWDTGVELVWNGKMGDVTNVVMPFQTIEHIDEPRSEKELKAQPDLFDLGAGRQLKGWTNKLIWGENKFTLSSLKNGPLREEIE